MRSEDEIRKGIDDLVKSEKLKVNEVIMSGQLIAYSSSFTEAEHDNLTNVKSSLLSDGIFTINARGSFVLTQRGYEEIYKLVKEGEEDVVKNIE